MIVKHALRAGLTPIVTAAGLDLAGLLGGAIIIEPIFSLPGIGRLSVDVGRSRSDLPVITGDHAGGRRRSSSSPTWSSTCSTPSSIPA